MGWIIRDTQGNFKGAGQGAGSVVQSALDSECQSLIHATQHLWTRGHKNVIFEGDNQVLTKVLTGNVKRFDIINWIHDIRS